MLENQKRALEEIRARNSASDVHSRSQSEAKQARESAELAVESDEVRNSLQSRLRASIRQTDGVLDTISTSIQKLLEKDDRLLDGLEKVLPQLEAGSDADSAAEVERLCQMLTTLRIAQIREDLDLAFAESASKRDTKKRTSVGQEDDTSRLQQRDSLRRELEDLCREIDGLATMSVDSEFRLPISRALRGAQATAADERSSWMSFTGSTLNHLMARLQAATDTSGQLQAHASALRSVRSSFETVTKSSAVGHQTTSRDVSPMKASQHGLKPLRLVQANLTESRDPVSQLLRGLDVRLPDSSLGTIPTIDIVQVALRESSSSLKTMTSSTENTIHQIISASLAKPTADIQHLMTAVFANSPYGSVKLVDQDLTEGIDDLEKKTQDLTEEMRSLDVEAIANAIRQKQQLIQASGS